MSMLLFGISANSEGQQFVELGKALMQGKTYFVEPLITGDYDTVFYNNHYYWPLGVFPAITMIPLILLSKIIYLPDITQGMLQLPLVIFTLIAVYCLSRKLKYSVFDSIVWLSAFAFSSMYFGQAIFDNYAYFANVIVVFLGVFSLLEFFSKRRWWLIGLMYGAILLTRLTGIMTVVFFVLWILTNLKKKNKLRALWQLLWPIVMAVAIFMTYNWVRFDDISKAGYENQILHISELRLSRDNFGTISLAHIPGNLYRILVAGPVPVVYEGTIVHRYPYLKADYRGMGLLITSPYLIGLFFMDLKGRKSKQLLVAVIITIIPLLLYYGVGQM